MALPLSAHVLCLVKGCLGTGLVTLSTLPCNQGNVLSPWTMARVGLQSAPPCKSVGAVPSVQMSSGSLEFGKETFLSFMNHQTQVYAQADTCYLLPFSSIVPRQVMCPGNPVF